MRRLRDGGKEDKLEENFEDKLEAELQGDEKSNQTDDRIPARFKAEVERAKFAATRDVRYLELFRYSTPLDRLLQLIGVLAAIGAGVALPLMTIIFGNLVTTFTNYSAVDPTTGLRAPRISADAFQTEINRLTIYFVYIFIVSFVCSYLYTATFIVSATRIIRVIRYKYLSAVLRQNIAYFDHVSSASGSITTRITTDTNLIRDGIGEKVTLSLQAVSMFVSAFVVAFIKSWKMTLVVICIIPALVVPMAITAIFIQRDEKRSLAIYSEGASLAEEVISTIRVAIAFGTQDRLVDKYSTYLVRAEKCGIRKSWYTGIQLGVIYFVVYASWGLAFWYGAKLLVAGDIPDAGIVTTVFFSVLIGSFSLGSFTPHMQALTMAPSAASSIYEAIERIPPIDSASTDGRRLEMQSVRGEITLKDVSFIYPTRPDMLVLDRINIHFLPGTVTALVGPSGSGKSSIVSLIERFYDIVEGSILFDGVDIRDLNLKWYRQQIAMVSQEPTLFNCTVFENVSHGLIGTKWEHEPESIKRDLVRNACEIANAHKFILSLPDGYDEIVGERATLLSGGQKQRIAIARAIVSDPKVLLLDEATSALDSEAESIVQDALDKASKNRTTICIAHRLSTIKGADHIIVMSDGRIVEQGTHDELLNLKGAYAKSVEVQAIATKSTNKTLDTKEAVLTDSPDDEEISNIMNLDRTKSYKSAASDALEQTQMKQAKTKDKPISVLQTIWRITKFQRPERVWLILSLLASIVGGLVYPVEAVIFAQLINVFTYSGNELLRRASFWSLMFTVVAIVEGIAYYAIGKLYVFTAEKLTTRLRRMYFDCILHQDVQYFDDDQNNTGTLVSSLTRDPQQIQQLVGSNLGLLLVVFVNIAGSCIIALAHGWKMALVIIFGAMPFIFLAGYLEIRMVMNMNEATKKQYEKSADFACEAVSAIRTVAILTREDDILDIYKASLDGPTRRCYRTAYVSTIWFALSQSVIMLANALAFWYGSTLVRTFEYSLSQMFTVFTAVIFGSQSAGQLFSYTPNMTKARNSAVSFFKLYDTKPEIDVRSESGMSADAIKGDIELENVHFRYRTRPHVPVLRGISLQVKAGETVALVGHSGCGKSSIISLLERFYDPLAGAILVDGTDISTFNLTSYRNQVALVSQEPTLYLGSIRENILMGLSDKTVTDEDIERVCRDANIHDFIASLPEGYETNCGAKGVQMSGGQKQRIAIARALIRNPRILLLDEATSALDSGSERIVQEALDRAAKGRTTICVAHRLSTVQNADQIFVIDRGVVVESGRHEELYARQGQYFEMMLGKNN